MQGLARHSSFVTNRNAGLAVLLLSWPAVCIKISGLVALLSGFNVYSLRLCGGSALCLIPTIRNLSRILFIIEQSEFQMSSLFSVLAHDGLNVSSVRILC